MEYHVSKTGSDQWIGSKEKPFLSINKAAFSAAAGDTVIVHEGIYREWVNPAHPGLSDTRRITYQTAEGEKVIIKGSEQITDWTRVEDSIWKTELPNAFFGDYNPYQLEIFGDWLVTIKETKHCGDVYLNGMSFYEVTSYKELLQPEIRTMAMDLWINHEVPVLYPEQTAYVWFAEVTADTTAIYANFHDADPTKELVEINVRRSCFYPVQTGIDYITVRGFEMSQAATPWAPPTADQPGLLGANWSKGWIIENNIIHDSKCSAISLGKEASTGHNYRSVRKDKPGYLYQLEAVFSAERNGWSKEKIGSHKVRYNTIYDCGQNGIVGHLGCVFSEIHHNHIYNIAQKREYWGYEIAGIKFHAAIDTYIHHNRIHNCSLGLWSDWETQGTRFSSNIFYDNTRDFFVEVSHGPYIVDHNIFASSYSLDNMSQGGAYINNLVCGKMNQHKILDRSTQYHLPHSTKVKGFSFIYGGDDRFINNIFAGNADQPGIGTSHFDAYTTSLDEYISSVDKLIPCDSEKFTEVEQPVYIHHNAYFNGAVAFSRETIKLQNDDFDPAFTITVEESDVYLTCTLPKSFDTFLCVNQTTSSLQRVRIADADFENPDGTPVTLSVDLCGIEKSSDSAPGPVSCLKSGFNKIRIW